MKITSDNRIAADEDLTDDARAKLVAITQDDDDLMSILAEMALRIDRLEQRVTDLMRQADRQQHHHQIVGSPTSPFQFDGAK